MKNVYFFIAGVAVSVTTFIILCRLDALPLECSNSENVEDTTGVVLPHNQGIVITENDYNQLKNNFENKIRANTLPGASIGHGAFGGRIGKIALLELLNNLSPSEEYVDFRFGLSDDPVSPNTYILFKSKGFIHDGSERILFISNGGDDDSWCPPRCN
jgi:hypothetical protein